MTEATDAELGDLALAAAQVGAHAILREVRRGDLQVQTKAHAADFVTVADKAAELAIISLVRSARPNDAILAEESGVHAGDSGVRWVIDPLDGTMNFVHGRHDYAVSIGVERLGERARAQAGDQRRPAGASEKPNATAGTERDGIIVAGAIVRPYDGDWAMAGGGTAIAREGKPTMSTTANLAEAMVGIGLPSGLDDKLRVHGLLAELSRHARDFRRTGSSACELLALAQGQQDGYFGFEVNLWDVAAGIALVEAAGGAAEWVTTASGIKVLVAGTHGVIDDLIKLAKGV